MQRQTSTSAFSRSLSERKDKDALMASIQIMIHRLGGDFASISRIDPSMPRMTFVHLRAGATDRFGLVKLTSIYSSLSAAMPDGKTCERLAA